MRITRFLSVPRNNNRFTAIEPCIERPRRVSYLFCNVTTTEQLEQGIKNEKEWFLGHSWAIGWRDEQVFFVATKPFQNCAEVTPNCILASRIMSDSNGSHLDHAVDDIKRALDTPSSPAASNLADSVPTSFQPASRSSTGAVHLGTSKSRRETHVCTFFIAVIPL